MKKIIYLLLILTFCFSAYKDIYAQKIEKLPRKKEQTGLNVTNQLAFSDGNGVYLRWTTEAEKNVIGFYVYRIGRNGPELAGPGMIPGGYLRSRSAENYYGDYTFFDSNGDLGNSYYLETIGLNGDRKTFGRITPTYLSDLKPVAGYTSIELKNSSEKAASAIEKTELNYSGDLQKQFEEFILPPDLPTQRWVAAQPGVKIAVSQKGIYRVSRTELENAGFDVNTDSNQWQLYVDGREQSIIVGLNDSYVEFYGEGADTPESNAKIYYLIVGAVNGKRMESKVLRPIGASVAAAGYGQSFIKKERSSYISGILNGEAENFFGSQPISGSSQTPLTVNFNLDAINYNAPNSSIQISLQGLTVNPHQVQITLNGVLLDTLSWNGMTRGTGQFSFATSLLQEGANNLELKGLAGSNDFSLVESIKLNYSRGYKAQQNQLSFYTSNYKRSKLSGFTSPNIRVFDLSNPDLAVAINNLSIENDNGNYSVVLPSNRGRILYAVEDSAVKSPVSITQNFPSTLATVNHNAEMILITHRDWMPQANNWAAYRSGQGTSVEVVDVADIFDEFSYGSTSTSAMTGFFQYAVNNWQTPPSYILLLGDSTYDFRNYGNNAFNSYVPTKLVDTLYEETGSDEALCDFNNDGLAEIAVGRIPARSSAEVTQMLTKISIFEGNLLNAMDRGALFVADLPIGYDFEGVNNRISQQLPANMPKTFIPRSNPDARNLVLADLNLGRYIVNYSGHGSTLFWAASGFYHKNDLTVMTNTNNLTIFTLLTCLNGYFVSPSLDSFAETALKTPNGGAVIAWASSGKTTPDIQEIMATRFYQQISQGNITRIGDLVKDAKQSLIGGRDVRLSWTLFGDPAMKVR